MNISLFANRRAERFARLLDSQELDDHLVEAPSGIDPELRDLTTLTRRLCDLPLPVEPVPEFREGLRAVLMATIEREGIGTTAVPEQEEKSAPEERARTAIFVAERTRARRRARAFILVVTGLASAVLALSGASLASTEAMPGDPLYGFKRQAERAQLALSGSDIGKGELYLNFAKTRLDEARAVTDDSIEFTDILDEMDLETQNGVKILTAIALDDRDPEALDVIDRFVDAQNATLAIVSGEVTGDSSIRVDESVALIEDVANRSSALRALLPCGAELLTEQDDLGPVPGLLATCPASGSEGSGHTVSPSTSGSSAPGLVEPTVGRSTEAATASHAPATSSASASATPLDGAGLNGVPDDVTGGLPG